MSVPKVDVGQWWVVFLLASGHGLADFNAGVLLAGLGQRAGRDVVLLYLLYNALAFAGQPLAGLLVDRIGGKLSWFIFGGLLSVVAMVVALWRQDMAVMLSGVASAFYHSAGGAEAWEHGGKTSWAAGFLRLPVFWASRLGFGLVQR